MPLPTRLGCRVSTEPPSSSGGTGAPVRHRLTDAVRSGVSVLDRIESLVTNPELYALADTVPEPDPTAGGRPRHYPTFMWVLYDALVSVYGSARKVQAELAHPIVWNHLRHLVAEQFRDDPARHLPKAPMRRHHYLYGRTTWLTAPGVLEALRI